MAVGVCCRWPLQTAVRDYFCHFIDRPFIFVKSQKKNKKNPKALLAKSNSAQEGSAGRRAQ
jgi:hypothetical protein